MSGFEDHNYPAFNAAAVALRHAGFTVLNPVDAEIHNPDWPKPQAWDWYMRHGIRMVTRCSKMALLPGWEASDGANLEHNIAKALKFDIRNLAEWLDAMVATTTAAHDTAMALVEQPEADPWCREENCEWRNWRSGSMPTHKRGRDCPPAQVVRIRAALETES